MGDAVTIFCNSETWLRPTLDEVIMALRLSFEQSVGGSNIICKVIQENSPWLHDMILANDDRLSPGIVYNVLEHLRKCPDCVAFFDKKKEEK